MKKIWDVTITKMGSIEVLADNEEEALRKAEAITISENIKWEDGWNAVDVCDVSRGVMVELV